jgi:hypothetical protein
LSSRGAQSNAGTPAPTGIQSSSSGAGTSANVGSSNPSTRTINATLTAQLANPFAGYATKGDITSATAALDAKFQSQLTALASAVSAPASGLSAPITVQAFAPSQRINQLSNITVSGVSGLTASDIPSLSYLPLSGGRLSGALINSSTASSTFAGAIGVGTTSPSSQLVSQIAIDTSQPATDTIQYVATDQSGLTATSTRTVIIQALVSAPPANGGTATTTP